MNIHHIAIWTHDLERLKSFYEAAFGMEAGQAYTNPRTGFQSYFLSFPEGAKIELMQMPGIPLTRDDPYQQATGIAHISVSVGSQAEVDALTERLEREGSPVVGRPRWTGDGYYESVILDPDGNRVEITI